MGTSSLSYESAHLTVYDSSYKNQSAILPTSTSRNSPTTKTFRGHATLASPIHIENNQQALLSTFQLSFNRLMMAVLPRSLFYARHRAPFFARIPTLPPSPSHGLPPSTHFPIS